MLHPFISTPPSSTASHRLGGTSLSLVVHAGLVAAAVAATAQPGQRVVQVSDGAVERVIYAEPARFSEGRGARASGARARVRPREVPLAVPDQSALATLLDLPAAIDVQSTLPPVPDGADFAGMATAGIAFTDGSGGGGALSRLIARAFAVADARGVFTEDIVERRVWPKSGNPTPRYPATLLDLGLEEQFLVRFVVDSTGRVDARSIEIPQRVHRLFVASVQEALQRSRYLPAELGGRRVRQLVEQVFAFRVAR